MLDKRWELNSQNRHRVSLKQKSIARYADLLKNAVRVCAAYLETSKLTKISYPTTRLEAP